MKRVLFDENMPRKLRRDLLEFLVRTVQEEDWAGLKNGELLEKASSSFDVLVTVDQGLRYQQNVAKFKIGVVVVETVDTTLLNLRQLVPKITAGIRNTRSGEITVIVPD